MKKFAQKTISIAAALFLAFGAVSCGSQTHGGSSNNPFEEKIDTSRTQLYVFNFDGGFGSDWLADVKKSYEELQKDVEWTPGKKGVQLIVNNTKTARQGAAVLHNVDEVYFTETVQYYQSISDGAFLDLTEAVTGNNPYEKDKSIESKMTREQKDFYGYPNADGKIYYGIPHYSGAFGLIYNKDLFEEKGYYFKKDYKYEGDIGDYFIYDPEDTRSAGPDGVYDTTDDGLPATFEEFNLLCQYIESTNVTPIVWSGQHYEQYLTLLCNQVAVNQEGLEQALLTFTMDGKASNLGKIVDGKFVKDSAPTDINPFNAYELYRQEGKYVALKFLETLIDTDEYHNDEAFTGTHSHIQAQIDFLRSGRSQLVPEPIAMLADGTWWQSEANETFKSMAGTDSSMSKYERNFGWMPLPRTADKVGKQKNVYFDHLYSMSFIKSNIAEEKKALAIDFLQYVHTDAEMVKFTKTTNTPKAYNYELTEADKGELTPFGRSLIEFKNNADVLYPISTEPKFLNNQSTFSAESAYASTIGGIKKTAPSMAFRSDIKLTAESYFNGLMTCWEAAWKSLH